MEGELEGVGRDLNSEPEAHSSTERRKKLGRGGLWESPGELGRRTLSSGKPLQ